MTYAELVAALHIFGYSERDRLTASQIRRRHRELVKANHPDRRQGETEEPMRKINAAAALLKEYLDSYRVSFAEDEFYFQNPDELLRRQFLNDPVWGGAPR